MPKKKTAFEKAKDELSGDSWLRYLVEARNMTRAVEIRAEEYLQYARERREKVDFELAQECNKRGITTRQAEAKFI